MYLTIDKSSLTKALAHVASVVERRNTIPILSNVHLATGNNELKLTSTDLDMEIVETVPARTKGEGATTVPAHMFHDIVRKLPEGSDIEIARDGKEGRLTISCGQARFSLQTLPADDFPALNVDDLGHAFTMSAAELKRLIAGLPGLVTVVAPPEARAAVAEWAEAGLAGYDHVPGVRPGDPEPERQDHLGEAAHAHAADADEVDLLVALEDARPGHGLRPRPAARR